MTEARFIRRRAFVALALAATLSAAGCMHRRTASIDLDDSDAVTLVVVNHHRLNVTIFNVAQGRRERMGEVTAASTGSFKVHLRRLVASELQLFADAVGSPETVRSELLHLSAGDTIEWTLETGLARSHVMVR